MEMFDDIAEAVQATFGLSDEKTRLVRAGLVVVTVVIVAKYVKGVLAAK